MLTARGKFSIPREAGWWLHLYACDTHGCPLVEREKRGKRIHVCPVCHKEFTGPAIEGARIQRLHNAAANAARDLAFLDALEPNPAHAAAALRILDHYAAVYPARRLFGRWFGKGRMCGTVLGEATWILSLAWAADLLRASGRADPRRMRQWFDALFLPCAELLMVQVPITHNIRCWLNAAIGSIGYLYDDADLVEDAVHGYYGFFKQLKLGTTSDGLWFEGTLGYHYYALQALLILAETARRNGADLSSHRPLRKMSAAPFLLALPDGTMPAINDWTWGRKPPISLMPTLLLQKLHATARALVAQRLAEFLREPRRLLEEEEGVVTNWGRLLLDLPLTFGQIPVPRAPAWPRKTTLPEAGLCVLRDAAATQYLMLKFGPHGGGHGHFDKPGALYVHGAHSVLLDAGTARYSSPLHEAWYRSTLAHNTVAMDGRRQLPCTGRLVRATENSATVTASPYDGARFERKMTLRTHGLTDTWKIAADRSRRIEILYHFPAPKEGSDYAIPHRALVEGNDVAYRYLAEPDVLKGAIFQMDFEGFRLRFSWKASARGVVLRARTPGISGTRRGGLILLLRFKAARLNVGVRLDVQETPPPPAAVVDQESAAKIQRPTA